MRGADFGLAEQIPGLPRLKSGVTGLGELCGFAPRAPSPAFVILNLIQDPGSTPALLGPDFRQDDERWGGEGDAGVEG